MFCETFENKLKFSDKEIERRLDDPMSSLSRGTELKLRKWISHPKSVPFILRSLYIALTLYSNLT